MRPPRGGGRCSRAAATTACPDATHVADRFHLLQGLSRAVEKVCHQHRSCLKKHAERGPGPAHTDAAARCTAADPDRPAGPEPVRGDQPHGRDRLPGQ
ncbi:transposase [Streptomyces sp. NPDC060065]|uniref:transposase n=1 Tax=Streptomyces sp. NPDC060065 TaxID=3347050 RepID=UPI0036BE1785